MRTIDKKYVNYINVQVANSVDLYLFSNCLTKMANHNTISANSHGECLDRRQLHSWRYSVGNGGGAHLHLLGLTRLPKSQPAMHADDGI